VRKKAPKGTAQVGQKPPRFKVNAPGVEDRRRGESLPRRLRSHKGFDARKKYQWFLTWFPSSTEERKKRNAEGRRKGRFTCVMHIEKRRKPAAGRKKNVDSSRETKFTLECI